MESILNYFTGHKGRPGSRGGSSKKGVEPIKPVKDLSVPYPRTVGVGMEVAPNPDNTDRVNAWNKLSDSDKVKASKDLAEKHIPTILRDMKLDGQINHVTGGFEGHTNPSVEVRLPAGTPYDKAREAGIALGSALGQKAVIPFDEGDSGHENAHHFTNLNTSRDLSPAETKALYEHISKKVPEASGMVARKGQMSFGNFSGLKDEDFHKQVSDAAQQHAKGKDYTITPEAKKIRSEEIGDLDSKVHTDTMYGQANNAARLESMKSDFGKSFDALKPSEKPVAPQVQAPSKKNPEVVAKMDAITGNKFSALPDEYFQPKKADSKQTGIQKGIAKDYDKLRKDNLEDPRVSRAYHELASEVKDQYRAIQDKMQFEAYPKKGEPYKNSSEMQADVRDNHHLFYLPTGEGTFGSGAITGKHNPMLQDSGFRDAKGNPMLNNDVFRAVHDYIAHGSHGSNFDAAGEESAWRTHLATLKSPWAKWALTSETRGQNSWVNYRDELIGKNGMPRESGDKGFIPVKDRPFAEQKNDLLPVSRMLTGHPDVDKNILENPEFLKAAGNKDDTGAGKKLPKKYGSNWKAGDGKVMNSNPHPTGYPNERLVVFDNLPKETQSDIAYHLSDSEHSGMDETDTMVNLADQIDAPVVPVSTVASDSVFISPNRSRSVSLNAVKAYVDKLKSGSTPPPIIVVKDKDGFKLIEGGHRLMAAKQLGKTIPIADITGLKNGDWSKWINNKEGHGIPTISTSGGKYNNQTGLWKMNNSDFGHAGRVGLVGGSLPKAGIKLHQISKEQAVQIAARTGELKRARNAAINKAFQDKENPAYKQANQEFNQHRAGVINLFGLKAQNHNQGLGLDEQQVAERMTPEQAELIHRAVTIDRIKSLRDEVGKIGAKGGLTPAEAALFREKMTELQSLRYDMAKPIDISKIPTIEERKSNIPSEIVLTARNDLMRNKGIFMAVVDAAAGTYFNTDTALDNIVNGNNKNISASELYHAFDDTRTKLEKHFGQSLTLYRAVGEQKDKATTNWASTRAIASQYGNKIINKSIPVKDIFALNVGFRGNYEEFVISNHDGKITNSFTGHSGRAGQRGGSAPRLELRHYGHHQRDVIDPKYYGQGYAGKEKSRARDYAPIWVNRSYWYLPKTAKEEQVGTVLHKVTVPKNALYDFDKDPENFREKSEQLTAGKYGKFDESAHITQMEKLIKDAGYLGYVGNLGWGKAAAIFHPVKAGDDVDWKGSIRNSVEHKHERRIWTCGHSSNCRCSVPDGEHRTVVKMKEECPLCKSGRTKPIKNLTVDSTD